MARIITHTALEPLKQQFPEVAFKVGEFRGQVTVVVPKANIVEVCQFLRNDPRLDFDLLADLSATDYLNFPGGAPGRFGVNYLLTSISRNERLFLKVYLDPQQPTEPGSPLLNLRDENVIEQGDPGLQIDSVTSIWPGAEWMEREAYDMLGIVFLNHPDLRRILTWNGFGNHPLRKDYPLRGVGERENYKIVTRDSA